MLRFLLALPLLAATVLAGGPRDLAELLPPETPLFILAQGPTPQEEQGLAYWKCMQEPALKRLLDRVSGDENSFTAATIPLADDASLMVRSDVRAQPLGVHVRYVDGRGERRLTIRNRFALAWIGVREGKVPVDLLGAFETDVAATEAIATLRRVLSAAILMLHESEGVGIDEMEAMLFTESSHQDVVYTRLTIEEGVAVYLVPLDRLVVLATDEGRVRDLIERFHDPGRSSLASDPRHRAVGTNAVGQGTITMRIELFADRALDALQAHPQLAGPVLMARNYMQAVGLGGLKGFTAVSRVDGAGVSSTLSVLIEGEKRGLGKLFGAGPKGDFGALAFAPKDTLYVTCGSFDPGGLYQIATEVLGAMAGVAGLKFQDRFGLGLRADLLDLVGPQAALIVAPTRGLLPDVGLVLDSKDPEHLQRSILTLLGQVRWAAGSGIKKTRIAEADVYVVPLGDPKVAGLPLAPCFGVVDGRLLVAPYPLSFQRFAAVKRGEREGLAANRDFVTLRQRVPEGAVGISYMDLPRVMGFLYDTAMPILQSLPETSPGQRAPLYELPDIGFLDRHLYGRIGWTVIDERGKHWCSHGSVDMTGVVLGSMGAATGIAAWLTRVEEAQAPQEEIAPVPMQGGVDDVEAQQCLDNVRFIRGHLRLYRHRHERFPASLDDMRHVPPVRRVVPGTDKRYVYLGAEGEGAILLHGHPNGADGKITVLTKRMQTLRVTAEELQRLLRAGEREAR